MPSGTPLFQNKASPRAIAEASGLSIYAPGTDNKLPDTVVGNVDAAGNALAEDAPNFDDCLTKTASKSLSCLQPLPLRC